MPTTVYDEVFDGKGKLISSTPRDVPDPVPSDKERIVQLEAELAKLNATFDVISTATTFDDAKTKIAARDTKDAGEIVIPATDEEPIDTKGGG